MTNPTDDLVVLLAADGSPSGTMPKRDVHHASTPLHAAFSSYLFSPRREVLMTRRALTKTAWPGVWTNTACGHPRPGMSLEDEVMRRVQYELGVPVLVAELLLPDFTYRATDVSGVVEHEVCPVVRVELAGLDADLDLTTLRPNSAEVCDATWVPWQTVVAVARTAPNLLSPWCVLQVLELVDAGWEPPTR